MLKKEFCNDKELRIIKIRLKEMHKFKQRNFKIYMLFLILSIIGYVF